MKNLQKTGGIAALYLAAALLFAMVGYLVILGSLDVIDPVEKVAQLVDNQAFLYILNLEKSNLLNYKISIRYVKQINNRL